LIGRFLEILWTELDNTTQVGSGNNGFKVVVRAKIRHFCCDCFYDFLGSVFCDQVGTICVRVQGRVGWIEGGKEWGDGKGLWKMRLEK